RTNAASSRRWRRLRGAGKPWTRTPSLPARAAAPHPPLARATRSASSQRHWGRPFRRPPRSVAGVPAADAAFSGSAARRQPLFNSVFRAASAAISGILPAAAAAIGFQAARRLLLFKTLLPAATRQRLRRRRVASSGAGSCRSDSRRAAPRPLQRLRPPEAHEAANSMSRSAGGAAWTAARYDAWLPARVKRAGPTWQRARPADPPLHLVPPGRGRTPRGCFAPFDEATSEQLELQYRSAVETGACAGRSPACVAGPGRTRPSYSRPADLLQYRGGAGHRPPVSPQAPGPWGARHRTWWRACRGTRWARGRSNPGGPARTSCGATSRTGPAAWSSCRPCGGSLRLSMPALMRPPDALLGAAAPAAAWRRAGRRGGRDLPRRRPGWRPSCAACGRCSRPGTPPTLAASSIAGHGLGGVLAFDVIESSGRPVGQRRCCEALGDAAETLEPQSEETVESVLQRLGLGDLADQFAQEQIDLETLRGFTEQRTPRTSVCLWGLERNSSPTPRPPPTPVPLLRPRHFHRCARHCDASAAWTSRPAPCSPWVCPLAFFLGAPAAAPLWAPSSALPAVLPVQPVPPAGPAGLPPGAAAAAVPARPCLLPHHKGRKRLHLELRDGLARVGSRQARKTTSSWTRWPPSCSATLCSRASRWQPRTPADPDGEDQRASPLPSTTAAELTSSCRSRQFETFNEYLFAVGSHAGYWSSEDTALAILREAYLPLAPGDSAAAAIRLSPASRRHPAFTSSRRLHPAFHQQPPPPSGFHQQPPPPPPPASAAAFYQQKPPPPPASFYGQAAAPPPPPPQPPMGGAAAASAASASAAAAPSSLRLSSAAPAATPPPPQPAPAKPSVFGSGPPLTQKGRSPASEEIA
uniref:DDHD domain-containing protein n=1 Tax=Macrostomum lignano TaxID=282301 RepID=A0A1I8FKS9_9PLAT